MSGKWTRDRELKIGRRGLLGLAPILAMTAAPAPSSAAQPSKARADEGITTPASAAVETNAGKVRGYLDAGIYTFKGMHYAASPEGAARFTAPKKAEPWTGVRSAMVFGPKCPQPVYVGGGAPSFIHQGQNDYVSEDCLRLNVWTPGINDSGRRPVMVWFHGGAFIQGSANTASTWGRNLAKRGDVVVVSVHHRLGVFGHLDLSAHGAAFVDTANAGALDMVAALEWVRDNISRFGGDPGNITLFGQSGGGAKVATIMAMPRAKGLFHRAIVQSSSSRINDAEQSERLSAKFLAHLGRDRSSLASLYTMPADQLVAAGVAVSAAPLNPGDDWRPKVDGRAILQQPFEPAAPGLSAHIPVLIGGTRHEFAPPPAPISEAAVMEGLSRRFGADKAADLRAFLMKEYPGISPNELLALVNVQPYRANHLKNAARLAARNAAPAYYYIFAWKTPNLDGLPLAFHGAELPFVFDNVDECATFTSGSAEAHALASTMADAWIAFARTGNPNHKGMPSWTAFDPAGGNTLVFDTRTRLVNHPWQAETDAVVKAAGGMFDKPSAELLGRPERSGQAVGTGK